MELADRLRETLDVDSDEVWENERTPTPVRVFGVYLHSMGLSIREGLFFVVDNSDILRIIRNKFVVSFHIFFYVLYLKVRLATLRERIHR